MTSVPGDPTGSDDFTPLDGAQTAVLEAEDLFVHGLLGALHEPDSDRERVDRVMEVIRVESGARRASGRRIRRFAGVMVALLALVGAVFFLFPRESSAHARVRAAIKAARQAGNTRYEIRTAFWPDDRLDADTAGTMDSSGDGAFFLQIRGPLGHVAEFGKDGLGEWSIRREGGIDRERPRGAWPRWGFVGGEPILAESVDQLLVAFSTEYTLRVEGLRAQDGSPGDGCDYIICEKKDAGAPRHAQRVELLIDRATMMLERLEMFWAQPAAAAAPLPPGQPQEPPQRRPKISRVVMNRVPAPEIGADWYSPEAHTR